MAHPWCTRLDLNVLVQATTWRLMRNKHARSNFPLITTTTPTSIYSALRLHSVSAKEKENMERVAAEIEQRNRNVGTPSFRGAGPQDADDKISALANFELPTLNQFLVAAQTGRFPGNKDAGLPLWPKEEMGNFSKKYKDWAPSPWAELPQPAGPFGLGPIPGDSPPAVIRMMHILSGLEDIVAMATAEDLGRSEKLLKTKIWFGLPPVSEAHWAARGLDDERNIEEALAILKSVVDVFDYFRQPRIQGELRDKNLKIFVEMDTFQDASNALRTTVGEPAPEWSLSQLWLQYVRYHLDFMESQARAWLFKRLLVLQTFWKARFLEKFTNGRVLSATHGTVIVDHYSLMIQNKIQDLYLDVDMIVRFRPDGFLIRGGIAGSDPRLCQVDSPPSVLNEFYRQIEEKRMTDMKAGFAAALEEHTRLRIVQNPELASYPEFMKPLIAIGNREFMHKSQQPHIENPPPFATESWVRTLAQDDVERFGFVIYRLSYKETDEEWEKLRTQLEEAINSGWEGVVGAEKVKHKAVLHWIDGRSDDAKIPEGDLQAARRHYKTLSESQTPPPKGLARALCLAVTPLSLSSLQEVQTPRPNAETAPAPGTETEPATSPHPGDFSSFLHAIDISFDEPTSTESSSSSSQNPAPRVEDRRPHPPGYDGTLKISSHLLYPDLYALHAGIMVAVNIQDMWSVSVRHPWGVYVGPSTGVLRRNWREMYGLGGIIAQNAGRVGVLGFM